MDHSSHGITTDNMTLLHIVLVVGSAVATTVVLNVAFWIIRRRLNAKLAKTTGANVKLSANLEDERAKANIIINSIGDGVMVIDREAKVQLLNPVAEDLTGWQEGEAKNLDYRAIIPLVKADGAALGANEDPFSEAFKANKSLVRDDISFTNRVGKRFQLSMMVSPLLDSRKNITGGVAVFRDITSLKLAERQRDEFISTASHEMRTPVAAIEGFLALALNPKVSKVDEAARGYLLKAHDSTKHLGELFQDLLSTTQLEEGRLASHPRAFEVGDLVNEVVTTLKSKASQKGLALERKDTNDNVKPLYYVFADRERIQEVLINLIDNALKYTEKGKVTLSLSGDEKNLTVGVHDTGLGIAPDDIKHLFQKFYRVDSSKTREIGGTGLGLYICRNIIELYHGRIWAESKFGEGSHFYFTLPRMSYKEVQAAQGAKPSDNSATHIVAPIPTAPIASSSAPSSAKIGLVRR